MSRNNLMEKKDSRLYSGNIEGYAYVKDSVGNTSNVIIHIVSYINTDDNSTEVSYTVSVFQPHQPDYFRKKYTIYSDAVDKYNELVTKWDGYRVMKLN